MYRLIAAVSLLIAPLAPAIVFGLRAWQWLSAENAPAALAAVGAIGAGVTLESVGALSGHVTMRLWRSADRRWIVGAIALMAYGGIGAYEAGASIGAALFALTILLYIVVALEHDATTVADGDAAAVALEADRRHELARLRVELKHQERIAVATSKPLAAPVAPVVTPLVVSSNGYHASSYVCKCGREFSNPQALGGHRRYCNE